MIENMLDDEARKMVSDYNKQVALENARRRRRPLIVVGDEIRHSDREPTGTRLIVTKVNDDGTVDCRVAYPQE